MARPTLRAVDRERRRDEQRCAGAVALGRARVLVADDARRIREAAHDPYRVCDALGLLDEGRGRTWFADNDRSLRVRCPWHDERTGSCSVSVGPDGTIRVRCFGCPASGDVLSLVAAVHRLDVRRDFQRVLELAAEVAGVARPENASPSPRRAPAPIELRVEPERDDGTIGDVAHVLRELVPVAKNPEAMEYLRARRIAHGPAWGWFALPDDPQRLDALRHEIVDHVGQDAWMRTGLAWPSGCFAPRWAGRLVVPWEAPNGAVEYLVGRSIGEPREGEPRYEGLKGRRANWPWGGADLHELAGPDTAVAIVEGAVDALSFNLLCARHGVDCIAIALPGVNQWRDAWADLARDRPAVVALDADKAGQRHTDKIKAALARAARSVDVREPASGKDWNDMLCSTEKP
jgi:DNA primase